MTSVQPVKALVIPGASGMTCRIGDDGLYRLRCKRCNAYRVLDLSMIDTTRAIYLTHQQGCPVQAHIDDPANRLVSDEQTLKVASEINKYMAKHT